MKITVNSTSQTVNESSRVSDLLREIKLYNKTGIAVAVNNGVIPRKDWEQAQLSENDKVTIINATQGG
jgi:sulfur carrier protein